MKVRLRQQQPGDRLDAVFASVPIDRVAERVTRQSQDDYPEDADDHVVTPEPEYRCPAHHFCSEERPELMTLTAVDRREMRMKGVDALLRVRYGTMTVIGVAKYRHESNGSCHNSRRWVLRCDCGRYEYRTTRALRGGIKRDIWRCDCCEWIARGRPVK